MYLEILVQQFCDYSLYFSGRSKDTIRRYKQVVKFYRQHAGIELLEQVTEENVRAYFFYGRTQKNWSSSTYISYHNTLTVFFRWCVEKKFMQKNPMDEIEMPRLEKRIPSKLTKQDSMRLLEVVYNYPYPYRFMRYRNHAILSTFIFAGLRKSELIHLKFTDVDIENLTIFVRQGKGSKDRIVPISYTLANSLKIYLEERKRLNKTCAEFFLSLNRNSGFTDSGLKRLVDSIRKASGIFFTIHKLRHTFATLMLEGGCDIYSLSKMMGHSDIKTTTIYLAASAEHLRAQMTKHPLNDDNQGMKM